MNRTTDKLAAALRVLIGALDGAEILKWNGADVSLIAAECALAEHDAQRATRERERLLIVTALRAFADAQDKTAAHEAARPRPDTVDMDMRRLIAKETRDLANRVACGD